MSYETKDARLTVRVPRTLMREVKRRAREQKLRPSEAARRLLIKALPDLAIRET